MKKCFLILIFGLFIFFPFDIFTLTRAKIIAIYAPNPTQATVKELKLMGINTVFIKPNINAVTFFKNNGFDVFISMPVFYDTTLLNSNPELNAIDKNGDRLPKISWYRGISPTVDWYREHILKKIKYILEKFPVKALFLDFIRYPVHWEEREKLLIDSCFSNNSLKKFEAHSKIKIPENLKTTAEKSKWIINNYYNKWVLFKNYTIRSFVYNVRKMINEISPNIKLGAFIIPWKESDYSGAIKNIAAQDIKSLADLLDYISPMAYHKMLGNNHQWLVDIISYFNTITQGKVLPVIQAFNIGAPEFLETLRIVNTHPALTGFTVFGYNHLNIDKKKILHKYIGSN